MTRRVTSHDVAELAGVSRSAVSLVLNGRADGVISRENQDAVRRAAKRLGYRPNSVARSLRTNETQTIGVVSDSVASGTYGGAMLAGAAAVAQAAGYLLLVNDTGCEPGAEQESIEVLQSRQCDGLLFMAESRRVWELPEGFPAQQALLLNASDPAGRIPGVVGDEVGGGRAATRMLLEAGHRDIVYLAGTELVSAAMRIEGHHDALAGSGARSRVVPCGWSLDAGRRAASALLELDERPTGIMCANDRVAAGVWLAAAEHNLRIPEDLSVVGYDDDPNVADQLGLSTVQLPHHEIGTTAARLLVDLLVNATPLPHHDVVVPEPPVPRRSVAPPAR